MADAVMRGHLPRLPKKVEEAPVIKIGLEIYFSAYVELMSCRQVGYGYVGAIPWTAVAQYAQFHSFDHDQFLDLSFFVRSLDEAYLKWSEDRLDKGKGIGG